MNINKKSGIRKSAGAGFGGMLVAGAAALGMALASPASAHGVNLHLGDNDDLLEDLIEMDADDIQGMRADFADARADIEDAIADIEEAREEAREAPGGAVIAKIAFTTARAVTSAAVRKALAEVRDDVDDAERELATLDNISTDERIETQEAIDVLREELASLEVALEELMDALHG